MVVKASKAAKPAKPAPKTTDETVTEQPSSKTATSIAKPARKVNLQNLTPEERKWFYRKIKREAIELEIGNNSHLIVFPSRSDNGDWYKVAETSALYYTYRLAPRMNRKANIMIDSDRYSKCKYSASIVGIERFIEQFEALEGSRPEITEDGIYIFTLKTPLTDDEIGGLRHIEKTRRDRVHSVLSPKGMDPAAFQALLMVTRQLTPKVNRLEPRFYRTIGEDMFRDIKELLAVYYDFVYGFADRPTTGEMIMKLVNRLSSATVLLSEVGAWQHTTTAAVGNNIAELRRVIDKNFFEHKEAKNKE